MAEFDLDPEGAAIPDGLGIPRIGIAAVAPPPRLENVGRRDPGRGMPVPAGRANREPKPAEGGLRPEPAAGRAVAVAAAEGPA